MKHYIVKDPDGLKMQVFAESLQDAARQCGQGNGYLIKVGAVPVVYGGHIFEVFEVPEIVE